MNFDFEHQGSPANLQLHLDAQLRFQFSNAQRSFSYTGKLPDNWKQSYFQMFLTHPADAAPIAALRSEITRIAGTNSGEAWLRAAIDFVQTAIAYDHDKAFKLVGSKIAFPSETLLDKHGVCADKTILLAALLQKSGYGIGIFNFDRANHMALGLRVPDGYGNFGSSYAMVETTAATPIGQIPARYAGGIRLDSRPDFVPIESGNQAFEGIVSQKKEEGNAEKLYGKDYLSMSPQKQSIYREMHALKLEMDQSALALKACKGRLQSPEYERCQALTNKHNTLVVDYNALVNRFNAK